MLKIYISENFIQEKKYIIDTIFNDFLGLDYIIKYHNEANYKIVLKNSKTVMFNDAFFSKFKTIKEYLRSKNIPEKLKYAKNKFIVEKDIPIIYGNDEFSTTENEVFCGIDIFASSFFMLSRWEEFVIKEKDKHNRFNEDLSFIKKNKIHFRPIVNEYVEMLWKILKHLNIQQKRKQRKYKTIITHDIDFIQKYDKFLKLIRAVGGDVILRKNLFLIPKTIKNYINIKKGKEKDLYDTFDFLMDISEKNNLKSRFYFIPGILGEYDVSYNIANNFTCKTINKILERGHIVGLHGTYESYNLSKKFTLELNRLQKITPKITEGRQHYLRFENPTTWQIWENNNLEIDSTIGFVNNIGFRAGTCYNYHVFNILTRKKLDLIEQPLIAMEKALKKAFLTPELFYEKTIELSKIVRKYKGNFVFLWHNNNLFTHEWLVYKSLYSKIIAKIN